MIKHKHKNKFNKCLNASDFSQNETSKKRR